MDRGQVYPIPALVAVVTLTLALTAYANVSGTAVTVEEPTPAVPALKQVEAAATTGVTIRPGSIDHESAELDGYHVNATLQTPRFVVHSGPEPPDSATSASVSVAVANDSAIDPGTLTVEVWPWAGG